MGLQYAWMVEGAGQLVELGPWAHVRISDTRMVEIRVRPEAAPRVWLELTGASDGGVFLRWEVAFAGEQIACLRFPGRVVDPYLVHSTVPMPDTR